MTTDDIIQLHEMRKYKDAIEAIHELLDGKEWDSDTTSAIADVVKGLGLEIREPDEVETCSQCGAEGEEHVECDECGYPECDCRCCGECHHSKCTCCSVCGSNDVDNCGCCHDCDNVEGECECEKEDDDEDEE